MNMLIVYTCSGHFFCDDDEFQCSTDFKLNDVISAYIYWVTDVVWACEMSLYQNHSKFALHNTTKLILLEI